MPAHRRLRHERAPAQDEQIVLARQAQHPLGVDDEALTPERMGDAAIAVMTVIERDALDEIAQVGVVAFRGLGREMAIVAGARYAAQSAREAECRRPSRKCLARKSLAVALYEILRRLFNFCNELRLHETCDSV